MYLHVSLGRQRPQSLSPEESASAGPDGPWETRPRSPGLTFLSCSCKTWTCLFASIFGLICFIVYAILHLHSRFQHQTR